MNLALKSELNRVLAAFEPYLQEVSAWPRWPDRLAEAARYSLFGGGKRVRPCLALLSAEAMGGRLEAALPWAAAVEMIHTYSLIHDDLPAMDDDDERRGRPTCHKRFDEATAILAGDALLTEAFSLISRGAPSSAFAQDWTRLLADAAGGGGMVGGQVEDIEGARDLAGLLSMQQKKTGALIAASVVGGGVSAGVELEWLARLERYGAALGVLFQVTDDLLDAAQDAEREGNSFLHHMSLAEVEAERDAWARRAVEAIEPLGPTTRTLVLFVEHIARREA
jgi:geranylgeranyl diphosphate synthase type II